MSADLAIAGRSLYAPFLLSLAVFHPPAASPQAELPRSGAGALEMAAVGEPTQPAGRTVVAAIVKFLRLGTCSRRSLVLLGPA